MPNSRPRQMRSRGTPMTVGLPPDLAAILALLESVLDETDDEGRNTLPRSARSSTPSTTTTASRSTSGKPQNSCAYVCERHLTNQRTDAVAMSVLDPQEVAEIALYPFWDLEQAAVGESQLVVAIRRIKAILARAEYTLFQTLVAASEFSTTVPGRYRTASRNRAARPLRRRIVPPEVFARLQHPDTRIARRASTLANLAKVISERRVSKGLRRTLLTPA